MSEDTIISVCNLGKCYTIYDSPLDRLKQSIWRNQQFYRKFWALRNINFEIKKGEVIGIIGRNGSGKSTLLQLLCNTLTATTGTINVHGRIAALLELGAGFNPEFTGRENVYMNGALLGFSKKEMDNLFDEIIAFADIGEFIDQPVKTYSSGMYVRLAFAVQVCVDPDILIIDEALSVGDIFFQQKCMEKFNSLKQQNKTLLIVSHDTTLMRDLCDRIIYLYEGQLFYYGDPNSAINFYLNNLNKAELLERVAPHLQKSKNQEEISPLPKHLKSIFENALWKNEFILENLIDLEVKLLALLLQDDNNSSSLQVEMSNKIKIQVLYWQNSSSCIEVVIQIKNRLNQTISCFKAGSFIFRDKGYYITEFELECMLEAGQYTFAASLVRSDPKPNVLIPLDTTPWLGPLTIKWDYNTVEAPFLGMFGIPRKTKVYSANFEPVQIS